MSLIEILYISLICLIFAVIGFIFYMFYDTHKFNKEMNRELDHLAKNFFGNLYKQIEETISDTEEICLDSGLDELEVGFDDDEYEDDLELVEDPYWEL